MMPWKYVKRVRATNKDGRKVASLEVFDIGEVERVVPNKKLEPMWVDIARSDAVMQTTTFSCHIETLEEATEEEYLRCLLAGRP